jgi:hypothetical protein
MRTRIFVGGLIGVLAALWCETGLRAASVVVKDSSFENLVREPSATTVGAREWILPAWGTGEVGNFVQDPPLTNQEDPNVGFIGINGGGGSAWFIDTPAIEAGTYTATVAVAHQPGREPATAPFKINFEAVGFGFFGLVGANSFPVGTVDSTQFTDISANLEIAPGQDVIGKYLRLVLVMDNEDVGTDPVNPGARYLMDKVRLEFTPTGGEKRDVWLGESSFQPTEWHRVFTDGGNAGMHRASTPLFPNQDGDQLGFATISSMGGFAGLWQDHVTIQPGTYTLSSGVAADPNAAPLDSYLVLKFEAVDPGFKELIGDPTFVTPDLLSTSTLTEFSNTVTIPVDSPLVGRQLRSVLVAEGAEFDKATYFFDNVHIEFTPDPSLPLFEADFNHDGAVDSQDLAVWSENYGVGVGADADGDGDSDGRDFLIWQRQVGSAASVVGAAVAVPEPTGLALIGILGASILGSGVVRSRGQTAKRGS